MKKAIRTALGWFVAGLFLFRAPLAAQELNPSQVFEKVKDSVVVVKSLDASGKAIAIALGSGVKLPSGRVVTIFHVAKEGARFLVGHGDHFVSATIYATDAEKDLCLLEVPGLGEPGECLPSTKSPSRCHGGLPSGSEGRSELRGGLVRTGHDLRDVWG